MPVRQLFSDEIPTLNLTPMIDVLLLLIIFFIVGTKFIESEKAMQLQIPTVSDKAQALTDAPRKRVINVFQDGTFSLDGKPVNLGQLTNRLASARRQHKTLGVLVRGDAEVGFQRVASVLNACKQAGIADLGISVRIAKAESQTRR